MAYISTEEVAAIRQALKKEFGTKFKFSVTRRDGRAVCVAFMTGDVDFAPLFREGKEQYLQLNHHHLGNYGEFTKTFEKVLEIIKTAPGTIDGGTAHYDNSDSQTDYFDVAYYIDMQIGKWNKPYAVR